MAEARMLCPSTCNLRVSLLQRSFERFFLRSILRFTKRFVSGETRLAYFFGILDDFRAGTRAS